jgi:rhodanese-related sulfurtransferase
MPNRTAIVLLSIALIGLFSACAPADALTQASAAHNHTDAPARVEAPEGAATAEVEAQPALQRNPAGYIDINVAQLADMLEQKDFTLVNVHIPYEGELPQTDLFIPFDEIEQHTDQLPAKDAPIVLYCRSGNMSTTAAEVLTRLGYTNVYELDGGFVEWEAQGYDLLHLQ